MSDLTKKYKIYHGYAIIFDKIDKQRDIIPKDVKIYINGVLVKNK